MAINISNSGFNYNLPVGSIIWYSGNCILDNEIDQFVNDNLPTCFLYADGSILNIEDYKVLFGVIGHTFDIDLSENDQETQFCLPNISNRFIRSINNSIDELGFLGNDSVGPHDHNVLIDNGGSLIDEDTEAFLKIYTDTNDHKHVIHLNHKQISQGNLTPKVDVYTPEVSGVSQNIIQTELANHLHTVNHVNNNKDIFEHKHTAYTTDIDPETRHHSIGSETAPLHIKLIPLIKYI